MSTPSAVSCKLNVLFKRALRGERFYVGTTTEKNSWGSSYVHTTLKDRKDRNMPVCVANVPGMRCCGMEELDFQQLQPAWRHYSGKNKLSPENWQELVARYIKHPIDENDHRMLFAGIPVDVGGASMYDIEFYNDLRGTLVSFGFKELCEPYKNKNSGNTIVALAGQL
jgi:hypothetical protein